ncbi:MAG: hypothetical protein M3Y56_14485 [Armatimonadota bacterium]|nr:hypothetical protein [Armatimonadota bacterium]
MGLFPLHRPCAVCSRRQSFTQFYYAREEGKASTWHRRCVSCYGRCRRTGGDHGGPTVKLHPIEEAKAKGTK